MIQEYLKQKTKRTFIFIFSITFIYIVLHSFVYYNGFKIKNFSSLQQNISMLNIQNKRIKKNIASIKKQLLFYNKKIINKSKLSDELNGLCSFLQNKRLLQKCNVISVQIPLQYINVATVNIQTGSKIDNKILEWFLNKIYYIKNFTSNVNGVRLEIFKKIKRQ